MVCAHLPEPFGFGERKDTAVAELIMEIVFSPFGYTIIKKWKNNGVGKEYLNFINGGKV